MSLDPQRGDDPCRPFPLMNLVGTSFDIHLTGFIQPHEFYFISGKIQKTFIKWNNNFV